MKERKKPPKWVASEIEAAVVDFFGWRVNVIVPNVSYGLLTHEADLLIMGRAGWCDEVEIKVSASDIKRDLGKGHGHRDSRVRRLWFAVPEHLAHDPNLPANAGVLSCSRDSYGSVRVETLKAPILNKTARRLTDMEQITLGRLGCMRIWSLKTALRQPLQTLRYEESCREELIKRKLEEARSRMRWTAPDRLWYDTPPRPT